MKTDQELRSQLWQLDGSSYRAYKAIRGRYDFDEFVLCVDYVQGDPFAAPSQLRVQLPLAIAKFPSVLLASSPRKIALRDYVTRQFAQIARQVAQRRGSGKSGSIGISKVGPEILDRSAVCLTSEELEFRFTVGLPAQGRRILGRQAADLLCNDIPEIISQLHYTQLDNAELQSWVETNEDAEALRSQLLPQGLVAFIADGAILPRASGVDVRPLANGAVPWQSPESLAVTLERPNSGPIRGTGIPQGITLIVGGGYHGKSTVLQALERGIYNHIPGDGRDCIVANSTAMKIRAEDGRSVTRVNISPFINHLPQGRSTTDFSTANASGSTSQAANIIEALEIGTQLLLIDEDTSATNFTIRDRRMQQLVAKHKEPITPFIDKVRWLLKDYGVSTILVMGGSGDYFDVADTVIALDNYRAADVTSEAKAIAQAYKTERIAEGGTEFGALIPRQPLAKSLDPSRGRKEISIKVKAIEEILFGESAINLSAVEQLVEPQQLQAIGWALIYLKTHYLSGAYTLREICDHVVEDIQTHGFDCLDNRPQGNFAQFRALDLAAAVNRLRDLKIKQLSK
ncbi:MAG: ABC-ATPase domain-containing protein [Cyanobacteria bacterium P01_H01_bin.15]